MLRVISAIIRGGFDYFAVETPSVTLILRFVTPERLSAAVDATADATDEGFADDDVCLCVIELSSALSQLSRLTQTSAEPGSIWCETFSLTFVEHILSQIISASKVGADVNQGVLQQQFAQKCISLLVSCREHTQIVESLLSFFNSSQEGLFSGDANVFYVRCVLLQALCHHYLSDIPGYLEDNQVFFWGQLLFSVISSYSNCHFSFVCS